MDAPVCTDTWDTFYPRPQLKRKSFYLLNGEWQLNGQAVRVPWPPQADLSGFLGELTQELRYETSFSLPEGFAGKRQRVMLHFGAVDQVCELYINDSRIGRHEGGYLPFSFDITDVLREGVNQLVLNVTDSLSMDYPYGKQSPNPHGMWYTQVSGIWQTVWLEAVPEKHAIHGIRITPDLTGITLEADTDASEYKVEIPLERGDAVTKVCAEKETRIEIPGAHLWSKEDPYLYHVILTTDTDRVESYFALRTFSIRQVGAHARFFLNDRQIFLHGVLDQGYYQEGIFLPGEPAEYERDILRMKELGFNMLRKHIKLEPEAFYYFCDKHGMLVLQDMVNSGGYSFLWDTVIPNFTCKWRPDTLRPRLTDRTRKNFFETHMLDTLKALYNHPCIVGYTIFNEGWGQFEADRMYELCKASDATRFFDSTSGWFAQKKSDVQSEHQYFKNKILRAKGKGKVLFLSECGGYTRRVADHASSERKAYGYGETDSEERLTQRILALYEEMVLPSIPFGLSGCVYTQLSDVEAEINGLYTYDREVCKVHKEKIRKLSETLLKE